jgi:fructosamine-3-kinase
MFEAESAGLNEMRSAQAIRVPEPVCVGESDGQSWLVMEYISVGSNLGESQRLAGEQLAKMHQKTAESFGWSMDNTIGSTPQLNDWKNNWIEFWREQRLGYQLRLAASKGFGGKLQSQGEKLLHSLDVLIDHAPTPSLLHGDLWGGNIGSDSGDNPVIFDPAVYYGDREADIAMTELFGGFSGDFYSAYNAAWPLDAGYKTRKTLYNLYHILNHLNLFGSGYAGQAQNMIDRLLAEIG